MKPSYLARGGTHIARQCMQKRSMYAITYNIDEGRAYSG